MAEQARGIVEVVNTNRGGYYGVKVGNDWYGAGKSHPGVDKGEYIEFEFTRNGRYMNLDPKTITKPQPNVGQAPSVSNTARGAGVTRDDYWANKAEKDEHTQAAINWQSARNSAIAAVSSMVEHGVVSLPAAKAKKYDVFMALVDEVSVRYFHDTAFVTENMEPPVSQMGLDAEVEEEGAPF